MGSVTYTVQMVSGPHSLSQVCVLREAYGSGKGKWNAHSKNRGGGEDPLILKVQLMGKLVVSSR